MSNKKTVKSRCFSMILYPNEDINHREILEKIKIKNNYAYITHKKDIYLEDAEEHAKGELKKEHTHLVIYFENPRSREAVAKELNLEINYIQYSSFVAIIQYLIHKNDKDKYQYDKGEIKTNMIDKVENALKFNGDYKNFEIKEVLNLIKENKIESFSQLVYLADEKKVLSTVIKNAYFFKQITRY